MGVEGNSREGGLVRRYSGSKMEEKLSSADSYEVPD